MARKNRSDDPLHGGAISVPRSRGAVSGILLIILGAFGVLAPLIGPWFHFGLTPNKSWHFTAARFWLEFLPGGVTILGGLMLLLAANRIATSFGAWLAVAGGAWFIVGNGLASLLHLGNPGAPRGTSKFQKAIEFLALFDGLGAIILFIAALALGRLSVRSVRDVKAAQKREAEAEAEAEEQRRAQVALEEQKRRDSGYEEQLRQEGAEKERARIAEEREHDEKAAHERSDRETQIRQDQQRQDAQLTQQRERDAQVTVDPRAQGRGVSSQGGAPVVPQGPTSSQGGATAASDYPPAGYGNPPNGR